MTTIKDIAEYTGVSATTVSNVIHGRKNRVSKETVERIQDAIEKLGYVPNQFARSLVSSSSKVIALINYIPTREDAVFVDESYQMSFLNTLETVLREHDYFLMYRLVETVDELKYFLMNWSVDGFFVSGCKDSGFMDALKTVKTPTVLVDSYIGGNYCDVGHDDFEGGRLATAHMIEKGHKKIAFASTDIHDSRYMEQRYKGYLDALKSAGIAPDESLVFESGVDIDSTRPVAEKIVGVGGVTGVITTTDVMAAGLIAAFNDMGIAVPDDISIVGFDDTPLSRMITPRLTTIRQDIRQKARTAAQCMLKILGIDIKDDTVLTSGRIVLPVTLVIRDSVKEIGQYGI